ncbi:MAG TPA: cysteine hydrolase [Anaeromyxobacteraceae bacterium]|nr:cysteine hydrolase [Anaeromyxobacteraceae bacterium]
MPQLSWQDFALLLVDVQKDFWSADLEKAFPQFHQNMEHLLRFCRESGIEVIHLREVFNDTDRSDWLPRYRMRGRSPCVRGTPGAGPLEEAAELPGEKIIEKQTQNGFHSVELLPYLCSKNKRYVLVAGLVTSVCVALTATSAAQTGFLSAIVADACADYPEAHELALKRYRGYLVDVANIQELPTKHPDWLNHICQLKGLGATARPCGGCAHEFNPACDHRSTSSRGSQRVA